VHGLIPRDIVSIKSRIMNTLHQYVTYRPRFQWSIVSPYLMRGDVAGLQAEICASNMIGIGLIIILDSACKELTSWFLTFSAGSSLYCAGFSSQGFEKVRISTKTHNDSKYGTGAEPGPREPTHSYTLASYGIQLTRLDEPCMFIITSWVPTIRAAH
jgi:hypothetical protein